jgi:hypothetical protein
VTEDQLCYSGFVDDDDDDEDFEKSPQFSVLMAISLRRYSCPVQVVCPRLFLSFFLVNVRYIFLSTLLKEYSFMYIYPLCHV